MEYYNDIGFKSAPLIGTCEHHSFGNKTKYGSQKEFGLEITTWTKSDKIVIPKKLKKHVPKHDKVDMVSALHGNECVQAFSAKFENVAFLNKFVSVLNKDNNSVEIGQSCVNYGYHHQQSSSMYNGI